MCRGSEKYFALMLYRLCSAERYRRQREGNVNLIYINLIVDWYTVRGGYC